MNLLMRQVNFMSDLKDIAGKYIESAKSLQSSSVKYLVGFGLIILFCWYVSETAFNKTKYHIIKLNKLELQKDSFRIYKGRLSGQQQSEYLSLKKTIKEQDSITADKFRKDIEENIPSGFKFFLKQSTQRPFGMLLTALIVFAFLVYLCNLRKKYLFKLGVALRAIKKDSGYNEIYDYNIHLPFWALPLPNDSINGVARKEVIIIGGLNKRNKLSSLYLFILLGILIFIQYRLYYISLITNSFLLNWILVVQSIVLFASLMIVVFWLLPENIRDTFRHEHYIDQHARRNFITASSFLLAGFGLGIFSHRISRSIISKILKPRYVANKVHKKVSNTRSIELKALEEIKNKDLKKTIPIIQMTL